MDIPVRVLDTDEETYREMEASPFHRINLTSCGFCGTKLWFPSYDDAPADETTATAQFIERETRHTGCGACVPKKWTMFLGVQGGWPGQVKAPSVDELNAALAGRTSAVRLMPSHRDNPYPQARAYYEVQSHRELAPKEFADVVGDVLVERGTDWPDGLDVTVNVHEYTDPYTMGRPLERKCVHLA